MKRFLRHLSLVAMLLWSFVHILIAPQFLEMERFIHAIIVIAWGELLLLLASPASVGTVFSNRVKYFNTGYALIYLVMAYLSFDGNVEDAVVQVLVGIGVGKLFISLLYREVFGITALGLILGAVGVYQIMELLSPTYTFDNFLGIPIADWRIVGAIDIGVFFALVFVSARLFYTRSVPSEIILGVFVVAGITLIGFGTWCAMSDFSWLVSSLIMGKGVVLVAIPAFRAG